MVSNFYFVTEVVAMQMSARYSPLIDMVRKHYLHYVLTEDGMKDFAYALKCRMDGRISSLIIEEDGVDQVWYIKSNRAKYPNFRIRLTRINDIKGWRFNDIAVKDKD